MFEIHTTQKLFIAAMLTLVFASCSRNSQVAFDSTAWKTSDMGEANVRFLMTDSLSVRLKPGMPQSEVLELLGKPDADSDSRPNGWLKSKAPFDAYEVRVYRNTIDYDTDYFIIEYDSELKAIATHVGTVPG